MVLLDDAGEVVHPAVLWNDTSSADATLELVSELGGPEAWADASGSVPVPSFTVTKLRWVRGAAPDAAARAEAVVLPHDWMTHRLAADRAGSRGSRPTAATPPAPAGGRRPTTPTGRSWSSSPSAARWTLPRVAGPAEIVGRTAGGAALAAGTGDNMAAALGLDLQPGDVAVSLGTSGTAFAAVGNPTADPSGLVAGFADATGGYLPLVCTLNAARVLSATARVARHGPRRPSTRRL